MKPLSPTAEAVFNASRSVRTGFSPRQRHAECIAAALRELVAQCAVKRSIDPDRLGTEIIIEAEDVIAIAKELEGKS